MINFYDKETSRRRSYPRLESTSDVKYCIEWSKFHWSEVSHLYVIYATGPSIPRKFTVIADIMVYTVISSESVISGLQKLPNSQPQDRCYLGDKVKGCKDSKLSAPPGHHMMENRWVSNLGMWCRGPAAAKWPTLLTFWLHRKCSLLKFCVSYQQITTQETP